ncbi:MAG: oxidoreductase [Brachybacterium sp.]|nr:oxidoreductase [Brachybacterium sp.]
MTAERPGGTLTLTDGPTLSRLGYGAMQLAGPGVWGPPSDGDEALAVLRSAVEAGIDNIDTAHFYGPLVTNELIRAALHPYDDLTIITKVGAERDEEGGWPHARSPEQLREQVETNLRTLDVDVLDVVNLRVGGGPDGHSPVPGSIAEPFGALAEMQREGKIRHLGLSVVDADQVAEARAIAEVVTVQNWFNIAHRGDLPLIADLAEQGVAYTAFWPLGGFSPVRSARLDSVAHELDATPQQVAIAWTLHQGENVHVIPGTSSREHLQQNIQAARLDLPEQSLTALDALTDEA